MASTCTKACCSGCSLPSRSNPSIVVICLPVQSPAEVTQERVALPSITTVQAPQRPSPQQYLLPVRSKSSLKTLRRLRAASALTCCLVPFTWSSVMVFIGASYQDTCCCARQENKPL